MAEVSREESVTISFAVEGLWDDGTDDDAKAATIIRMLASDFPGAAFNEEERIFVLTLNPRRYSFSDVRAAVSRAGQAAGRTYLANVMSP